MIYRRTEASAKPTPLRPSRRHSDVVVMFGRFRKPRQPQYTAEELDGITLEELLKKLEDSKVKEGKIYVLGLKGNPDISKVGMTTGSVKARVRSLQTGNPDEIYIHEVVTITNASVQDVKNIERFFHDQLKHHHIKGEWFAISPSAAVDLMEKATTPLEEKPKPEPEPKPKPKPKPKPEPKPKPRPKSTRQTKQTNPWGDSIPTALQAAAHRAEKKTASDSELLPESTEAETHHGEKKTTPNVEPTPPTGGEVFGGCLILITIVLAPLAFLYWLIWGF